MNMKVAFFWDYFIFNPLYLNRSCTGLYVIFKIFGLVQESTTYAFRKIKSNWMCDSYVILTHYCYVYCYKKSLDTNILDILDINK